MLLAVTMIGCNYTHTQTGVMALMSWRFSARLRRAGMVGDCRYFAEGAGWSEWRTLQHFGNLSTITTPTVIGFLVDKKGSFNEALIYVGATALLRSSATW